uniref:Uncharacterized protein n=1 Tax=Cucumis melo TaxID=3656 RepID=A0A9I9E877_CUCME
MPNDPFCDDPRRTTPPVPNDPLRTTHAAICSGRPILHDPRCDDPFHDDPRSRLLPVTIPTFLADWRLADENVIEDCSEEEKDPMRTTHRDFVKGENRIKGCCKNYLVKLTMRLHEVLILENT